MLTWKPIPIKKGSLRQRILASVGAMVLLSLLSSTMSLFRITEVNRFLEAINHVAVPLGRLFTQMQSDAEVFHRELERSLSFGRWKDSKWKPRPAPRWIEEVLRSEMAKVSELIQVNSDWATPEARAHWIDWSHQISQRLESLLVEVSALYTSLEENNETKVTELYPKLAAHIEDWKHQLQWGSLEYEKALRQTFSTTESQVSELRTGLEMILFVVVLLSLLLLWLGEWALRPLAELTILAREITRRGLRKEDKALVPEIPLSRADEVSQLAREFHNMATALLEREKTVESQKNRLQDQNRLLRQIGALNGNILNSIDSVLIVTDLSGRITQCNPQASFWLGSSEEQLIGSDLLSWPKMKAFFENEGIPFKQISESSKLGPYTLNGSVFGGHVMPLKDEEGGANGAILVLDDLTEEVGLQERLRQAENLAAVGRMSAQVAHEVRNPLHSIGLEAEMAAEMAAKLGETELHQSISSILSSVDRLQKITENYLKLSRLSDGTKTWVHLGEVLESVLNTYSPVCEELEIQVLYSVEKGSRLLVWADRDLMEQVFGNLLRNSLQAIEQKKGSLGFKPMIRWRLGNAESGRVWIRIEDNGPGVSEEVQERLFEPFFTTRAQGTGLGLSFIKKVLGEHSGEIRFVRNENSTGACFEILLPLPQIQAHEKTKFNCEGDVTHA